MEGDHHQFERLYATKPLLWLKVVDLCLCGQHKHRTFRPTRFCGHTVPRYQWQNLRMIALQVGNTLAVQRTCFS
eukprot:scaffold1189_cov81-Cylindrotheca_fusiformis.AAC.2